MQSEEDSQWLQQAEKRLSAGKLDPAELDAETKEDHLVTAGHRKGSQEDDNLVTAAPTDVFGKSVRDRSATPMTSSSSEDGGRVAVGKVTDYKHDSLRICYSDL